MIRFYLAQLFAVIAWTILIISYWKNKNDKILYLQVLACAFFILSYAFLEAWTGLLVVVFELFRDYLYIKFKDDKKTFLYTLPIYIIISTFSYNTKWSLFAVLASLCDGYALTYHGKKVVFLGILTYLLWLIYDVFCHSYAGALAAGILIISNVIILVTKKNNSSL